ncbi:hypothetical protein TNCV_2285011 [Trichonephila clavipes]|nr:hypothetical protein TNCV_2285011 [Trichonephila clavipes]
MADLQRHQNWNPRLDIAGHEFMTMTTRLPYLQTPVQSNNESINGISTYLNTSLKLGKEGSISCRRSPSGKVVSDADYGAVGPGYSPAEIHKQLVEVYVTSVVLSRQRGFDARNLTKGEQLCEMKRECFRWEVLDHLPYSPDLAPSDFHHLGPLKKHLRCQSFRTDDKVQEAILIATLTLISMMLVSMV